MFNSQKLTTCLRAMPLMILASLGFTWGIVNNPGLFWDDWVWFYQDPISQINIGYELGVFWAGYFNNVVYALSEPTFALRMVALASWIVSGCCISYLICKFKLLDLKNSLFFIALYVTCPLGLVRFFNSVSLYNFYIALFWAATVILCRARIAGKKGYASIPFFLFSFYLNSLYVLYGILIAFIYFDYVSGKRVGLILWPTYAEKKLNKESLLNYVKSCYGNVKVNILAFMKLEWLFVCLPILFIIHKKLVVLLLAPKTGFYEDYNSFHWEALFGSPVVSLLDFPKAIYHYFDALKVDIGQLKGEYPRGFPIIFYLESFLYDLPIFWAAVASAVVFPFVLLVKGSGREVMWKDIIKIIVFSWLLFAICIFPYVAVGKRPLASDFYEQRHFLTAIPAIILFFIAFSLSIQKLIKNDGWIKNHANTIVISLLLGCSLASGLKIDKQLWFDYFAQSYIMNVLEKNKSDLLGNSIIFVNENLNSRVMDRKIWNYEYTGMAYSVFRDLKKFAVSSTEFLSMPKNVKFLNEPLMLKRFNMAKFNIREKSDVFFAAIDSAGIKYDGRYYFGMLTSLWEGKHVLPDYKFFDSKFVQLYQDTDECLDFVYNDIKTLTTYRRLNGSFPVSGTHDKINGYMKYNGGLSIQEHSQPLQAKSGNKNYNGRQRSKMGEVVYISDGEDFKYVCSNLDDFLIQSQRHPHLIDRERNAVGFWTPAAKDW